MVLDRRGWGLVVLLIGLAIPQFSESALVTLAGVLLILSGLVLCCFRSGFYAGWMVTCLIWFSSTSVWALYLITGGGFAVSPWDFLISFGLSVLGTVVLVFILMVAGFVAVLRAP